MAGPIATRPFIPCYTFIDAHHQSVGCPEFRIVLTYPCIPLEVGSYEGFEPVSARSVGSSNGSVILLSNPSTFGHYRCHRNVTEQKVVPPQIELTAAKEPVIRGIPEPGAQSYCPPPRHTCSIRLSNFPAPVFFARVYLLAFIPF